MFHVCSISLFYEFYSVEVSLLFSWYQTNFEPYGNLYSFACSQYFKTVISQVNGRKYTSFNTVPNVWYIYTLRFVVYDSYSGVCNRMSTRDMDAFQILP
jgi:hypothetical protein